MLYNNDSQTVIPLIYLNGKQVSVVEHEKHLRNFLSTNIYDRHIITNVCDLYKRSIFLISDLECYDCITLDSLFNTWKSLLLSKLNRKTSTLTSNYHYLSCKYNFSHSDWYNNDTGDLHIGESIVKDKFYGTGFSLRHKDAADRTKWQQNKLGVMLMKERSAMRAVIQLE